MKGTTTLRTTFAVRSSGGWPRSRASRLPRLTPLRSSASRRRSPLQCAPWLPYPLLGTPWPTIT
eukprot:4521078-Alexandrium_andersonii.AAC.1